MNTSYRAQRALIWWSISFVVIFGLAWGFLIRLLPLPSPNLPAAEVARFYMDNASSIRLGATICSWVSAFPIPLAMVIAVQMRSAVGPADFWPTLQLVGGATMSIFLVLPPLFWGVAAFHPDRAADTTALIHDLANLTLVTTDQYFIFQMIPITIVALAARPDPLFAFPRWYGYFNIWIAFMFELGAFGFMFKSGPFAWNGLFVFWSPLSLFGVWISVTAWTLLRAISRQEAASCTRH